MEIELLKYLFTLEEAHVAVFLTAVAETAEIIARLKSLTPQQLRVLNMLKQGLLNKQIAHELGISIRAVGLHRRKILEKVCVESVVELTRLVVKLDL